MWSTFPPLALLALGLVPLPTLALSPQFLPCQIQKPKGLSPLVGCSAGTIYVSNDLMDKFATFRSIQAAVLSLYVSSL